MEDWERRAEAERRELKNWRGRRLRACRACDELVEIIENLGVEEDPSVLPPVQDKGMAVNPAMKAEMQNMTSSLLRMILIANDGRISPRKLPRF